MCLPHEDNQKTFVLPNFCGGRFDPLAEGELCVNVSVLAASDACGACLQCGRLDSVGGFNLSQAHTHGRGLIPFG